LGAIGFPHQEGDAQVKLDEESVQLNSFGTKVAVGRITMRTTSWLFKGVSSLLAVSLIHTAAWSIVRRHDRPDQLYLALANEAPLSSVGFLTTAHGGASGTLIMNGSWVLTAAHLFDHNRNPSDWFFKLGNDYHPVQEIYIHPSWDPIRASVNDIALVKLFQPVNGVTPAQIFTSNNLLGRFAYWVGYGCTGDGLTGYDLSFHDGKRRAMENIIDAFWEDYLLADFDHPDGTTNAISWGSPLPLNLEGCLAPGDSGGAVFVLEGGTWYLAGVNAFGAEIPPVGNGRFDAQYGDVMGATRVDLYADWINATVPEPASMTALAVGLAGVLARRRRR
jgi:hypothetical protein